MSRRAVLFTCEGARMAATLDGGEGSTCGLLIISGGNEPRTGPAASQARLAARIAAQGFAVFRFDRRGVGDSEGRNTGFAASGPDIAAALAAFRAECPGLTRVVAMGNCDAASALMLQGGAGADALILSNPWTFDGGDAAASDMMPARALRAHYLRRLASPSALWRLLTGKIALGRLLGGLRAATGQGEQRSGLAERMAAGLSGYAGQVRILIAGRDRAGQSFLAHWDRADPRIRVCPEAGHAFLEPQARDWLYRQVLEVLKA